MKILIHWLYGNCGFNVLVRKESKCAKCLHRRVCPVDMSKFCLNYEFGTSDCRVFNSCESCNHKFTRFDKDRIPCFRCRYFCKRS